MLNALKTAIFALLALALFIAGATLNSFLKLFEPTPLTITQNLSHTIKSAPTNYHAQYKFYAKPALAKSAELSSEHKSAAASQFAQIAEIVRANSICELSSHSISPRYDGDGHLLNASLSCSFDAANLASHNDLVAKIEQIVANSELIAMSVGEIKPAFSDEELAKNAQAIHAELVKNAQNLAATGSDLWGKKCAVKKVDFESGISPRVLKSAISVATLPVINEFEQSGSAAVEIVCE